MLLKIIVAAFTASSVMAKGGQCYKSNRAAAAPTVAPQQPSFDLASLSSMDCLQAHNFARQVVGLPEFNWDNGLASAATAWAQKLNAARTLQHSGGTDGENLYGGSSSCAAAVTAWVAEKVSYYGQRIGDGTPQLTCRQLWIIWTLYSMHVARYEICRLWCERILRRLPISSSRQHDGLKSDAFLVSLLYKTFFLS
jgi:Cysteine-rich secretory protein family